MCAKSRIRRRKKQETTYLEILEADFEVQLAGTGDDVLACLFVDDLHHGVGLAQALQPLHQLGEVAGHLNPVPCQLELESHESAS